MFFDNKTMARENQYASMLTSLRNGAEIEKTLKSIQSLVTTPENRAGFMNSNIFGVLKYKKIALELIENSTLVSSIKLAFCKDQNYTEYIAFEQELLRESIDYIFNNIQSKASPHGVYLQLSNLSSEFNEYPAKVFELLTYYFLIIYELGTKSYDVVLEVSKYNIVPKLLFAIEKGPLNIFVEKVAFKKSAQLVLNLILRFIDVADLVCTKLELFK